VIDIYTRDENQRLNKRMNYCDQKSLVQFYGSLLTGSFLVDLNLLMVIFATWLGCVRGNNGLTPNLYLIHSSHATIELGSPDGYGAFHGMTPAKVCIHGQSDVGSQHKDRQEYGA
jgi:hypothetical protein